MGKWHTVYDLLHWHLLHWQWTAAKRHPRLAIGAAVALVGAGVGELLSSELLVAVSLAATSFASPPCKSATDSGIARELQPTTAHVTGDARARPLLRAETTTTSR